MNYVNCEKLIKVSLPAIRIALASSLKDEYGLGQEGIAERLGITQASVSKYSNGRYSVDIAKLSKAICSTETLKALAKEAAGAVKDYAQIWHKINTYATAKETIDIAWKLFGSAAFE